MKTNTKHMKRTLVIAAVVAFGLATLGIGLGPISATAMIPLGLTLFVGSKLAD
jgi:hypothetical protein